MKFNKLIAALMLGACSLPAFAQDDDRDTQAVFTQIAPLQWTLAWEDYQWVDVQWYVKDNSMPEYRAFITDANNVRTYLAYGEQISAPDYGNYFTVNLAGMDLADGTYELTIPEGYVSLIPGDGQVPENNVTQYFDFTIGGDVTVSHTPHFSEIDGNTFDIWWENVTYLTEGNTVGATLINKATNETFDLQYLEDYNYSKANLRIYNSSQLRVNLSNNGLEAKLVSGNYTLHIPAGYVQFNNSDESNAEINYDFYYGVPWSEGAVEFAGPFENGTITVTYVDADRIQYNPDFGTDSADGDGIFLYDSTGSVFTFTYPENLSFEGNVMTINLNGLGIQSGECQLNIEAGVLLVTIGDVTDINLSLTGTFYRFDYTAPGDDGPDEPEITFYPGSPEWSVSNGDTVNYDTVIEVYWPGTTLEVVDTAVSGVGIHTPVYGYLPLEFGDEVWLSEDSSKLLINLSGYPAETWRLTVDEAYLYIKADGETYYNVSTWVEDLVINTSSGGDSAVEGIAAEDGRYVVYSLTGVRLLDTGDAADIDSLPSGVYVVNGKKVIIFR